MESRYAVDRRIGILFVLALVAMLLGLRYAYINYRYNSEKHKATHSIISLFHEGELSTYDLPGFYAGMPDGAMRAIGIIHINGCPIYVGAYLVKYVWKNRGYIGISLSCDANLVQDGLTKVAPDAALYVLPSNVYTSDEDIIKGVEAGDYKPDEHIIKGIEAGDYKPQTMASLKTLPYDTGPVEIILNPQGVGGLDLKDRHSDGLPLSGP